MRNKNLSIFLLVVISVFIITTCKKDEKTTEFEITEVTVTDNTVTIKGTIVSISGNGNTDYGVCYGTKNNPSVTDTALRMGAPKVGPFTAEIKNLKRNKTYFFRGFIKEGDEYIYDRVRSATIAAVLPEATTKAASSPAETAVTLNGSVNPNGSSTTVSFEYGLTTSYGTTIAAANSPLSGTTATDVNASLTALTPNTTYHFRVKATNSAGIVNGEDLTFTTLANVAAPGATSLAVTTFTNTSATLNGSVNANGSTTTVSFEYGTTFLYGSESAATPPTVSGIIPTSVTSDLTGLVPGQSYHFRVKAVSAGGTTYGDDLTFTTSQPPAVTTLDATSLAQSTATLNGTVNANGISSAVTFEYGTTTSYGTTVSGVPDIITGSEGTAVKADITGLIENTTYHFRIKAVSSAGTSYGNDLSFLTTGPLIETPVVTTNTITSIAASTATGGGNVTTDGGATVTERGICWSTTANPTVALTTKTVSGGGTGFFSATLSGLSASTQYYVRAYAINSAGTGYGTEVTFTTSATDPVVPTLTTSAVTAITSTTATGGGNITSDGGSAVDARGICYSTNQNPTIDDSKTINGSGTGPFSSPFTGLTPGTTYYVRAYATNGAGTAYGNQVTFTSSPPEALLPTVTTATVTEILSTTATGGGNVTSDGGGTVTARGVCWSTQENPTIADPKTENNTGTGVFVSAITGLNASTMYYVRAYATNSAGTVYGDQVGFITSDPPAVPATLTTVSISGITSSTASSGGNISNDGGGAITDRGVCWSTAANPTIAGSKTSDGAGSGEFSSYISGLNLSTLYYVRAYATNSAGTAYGNEISFTTADVLPSITTTAVTGITSSTASSGGNITGSITGVTARGVCWSTSTAPTVELGTKTSDGTGGGVYNSSITGLTPCTVYHVRAYATNSVGTVYGNEISFTSGAALPTITTTAITGITASSASSGGTITGNCINGVTARGICWNTTGSPTTANTKTINGTGGGAYISNMSGLTRVTTYYVRAYATNAAGTVYGNEISFTTLANLPTVSTKAITTFSNSNAVAGGNATANGGAPITDKGVCWNTSINPTIANPISSGGIDVGDFTAYPSGLSAGTTYYVRAYATNSAGTAYGSNVVITTPAQLTDVDGNVYKTVSISNQVWMQENLKVTRWDDGTNLVMYTDTMSYGWAYYHSYANTAGNLTSYGYLYNGYVIGNVKDICPSGWHVPTITEWTTLANNLGGASVAGTKMNDLAGSLRRINFNLVWVLSYWNNTMTGHDNSSLFNGRGGGYYFTTYAGLKDATMWWTISGSRYVRLDYNSNSLSGISSSLTGNSDASFYIRCKKD